MCHFGIPACFRILNNSIVHNVSILSRSSITFQITDTWGYRDENGSWSGMTGMLQRGEIDLGGTGTFFVKERVGVLDYVQLYTRTRQDTFNPNDKTYVARRWISFRNQCDTLRNSNYSKLMRTARCSYSVNLCCRA